MKELQNEKRICQRKCLLAILDGPVGADFAKVGLMLCSFGKLFMHRRLLLASLSLPLLASCASRPSAPALTGRWLQPVPGMPGAEQGFELLPDGSARSLSMVSLVYERWSSDGRTLVLAGKSVGNRQTIPFEERLLIVKLTETELRVRNGDFELAWHRAL